MSDVSGSLVVFGCRRESSAEVKTVGFYPTCEVVKVLLPCLFRRLDTGFAWRARGRFYYPDTGGSEQLPRERDDLFS